MTGLDPSAANIDVARQHAAVDPLTRTIRYEAATVEEFIGTCIVLNGTDRVATHRRQKHTYTAASPAHRCFHAVVASEVIEHVESPPAFMEALAGAVSSSPPEEEVGRDQRTSMSVVVVGWLKTLAYTAAWTQ